MAIRISYSHNWTGEEVSYIEAACLSTDTKPTDGVATGSILTEVDTGKVYMYDEDGEEWVEELTLQE